MLTSSKKNNLADSLKHKQEISREVMCMLVYTHKQKKTYIREFNSLLCVLSAYGFHS